MKEVGEGRGLGRLRNFILHCVHHIPILMLFNVKENETFSGGGKLVLGGGGDKLVVWLGDFPGLPPK